LEKESGRQKKQNNYFSKKALFLFVPREKLGERKRFVEDLKKRKVFKKNQHSWLTKNYRF